MGYVKSFLTSYSVTLKGNSHIKNLQSAKKIHNFLLKIWEVRTAALALKLRKTQFSVCVERCYIFFRSEAMTLFSFFLFLFFFLFCYLILTTPPLVVQLCKCGTNVETEESLVQGRDWNHSSLTMEPGPTGHAFQCGFSCSSVTQLCGGFHLCLLAEDPGHNHPSVMFSDSKADHALKMSS